MRLSLSCTRSCAHDTEIDRVTLMIAKLRRMQFGRSSEKLDRYIERMELKLEKLQTDRAVKDMPVIAPSLSHASAARIQLHAPRDACAPY